MSELVAWGRKGELPSEIELHWLSDDETARELVFAYWLIDSDQRFLFPVSEIADGSGWKRNEVAARITQLVVALFKDEICPECGQMRRLTSRSELSERRRRSPTITLPCESCQESARQRAREEAEDQIRRLADLVKEHFALRDSAPIDVSSLDFRTALTLLVLFKRPLDDNFSRSTPLRDWPDSFAPYDLDAVKLLSDAHDQNVLQVHPSSAIDAFTVDDDGIRFYLARVSYTAAGVGPTGPRNAELVRQLFTAFDSTWSNSWAGDAKSFASELLVAEAIEYLIFCLEEHGFSFKAGVRTRQVFARAFDSFSLASVYNLIWRAVCNAAAYYQRASVSKLQAANSVVNRIEGGLDRALAEGWDLKPYGRNFSLPWSVLSETFLVTVLGTSDPMSVTTAFLNEAIDRKCTVTG